MKIIYFQCAPIKHIAKSVRISENIILDFNYSGLLSGIEFLEPDEHLNNARAELTKLYPNSKFE